MRGFFSPSTCTVQLANGFWKSISSFSVHLRWLTLMNIFRLIMNFVDFLVGPLRINSVERLRGLLYFKGSRGKRASRLVVTAESFLAKRSRKEIWIWICQLSSWGFPLIDKKHWFRKRTTRLAERYAGSFFVILDASSKLTCLPPLSSQAYTFKARGLLDKPPFLEGIGRRTRL